MPGKYKDLIMGVATEEMGHVEMIATMVARLLEGTPDGRPRPPRRRRRAGCRPRGCTT